MTATVGFSRTTLGKKAVMAVTGLILFVGAEFSAALQREFWPGG